MKRLKSRLPALLLSAVILFSMTGCTDYPTWEAQQEQMKQEQAAQEDTKPDDKESSYKGPSLADYVNSGLEEAKNNGHYTETDYSDILGQSGTKPDNPPVGDTKAEEGPGMEDGYKDPRPDPTNQNKADALALERLVMMEHLAKEGYGGGPYITVHDNEPYFSELDYGRETFEHYMELDSLGRTLCGFALLDESLMPGDDEERGDISSVKPTGWVQVKYEGIGNGDWLYNRCHLIAWALAGENDNEKNLMTGTRYFNVEGMLPFELQVLNYLDENPGNHVLYRSEPVYDGDGLLAKGLLLEARSIEDDGRLSFCVYIFNVQPGIEIDYTTGESRLEGAETE